MLTGYTQLEVVIAGSVRRAHVLQEGPYDPQNLLPKTT
jgi:hypothetical protein